MQIYREYFRESWSFHGLPFRVRKSGRFVETMSSNVLESNTTTIRLSFPVFILFLSKVSPLLLEKPLFTHGKYVVKLERRGP